MIERFSTTKDIKLQKGRLDTDSGRHEKRITTVSNLSKVSTFQHNRGVADEVSRKWSQ